MAVLPAGEGSKGPRLYDWARACLFHLQSPPGERWLLICRAIANPTDIASYDATIVKIDMEVYKGRHLIENVLYQVSLTTTDRPILLFRWT
jgi:hypothetical protein